MNMSSKEINRMSSVQTSDVLARLKSVFAVSSDTELAKALDTSAQTISSWKSRNHIPYAICVDLAIRKGLSLDWLICGITDRQLPPPPPSVNEPGDGYAASPDARARRLLELFHDLNAEQQQNILREVQEKHRVVQMQRQIEQLQAEMLRFKKTD